MLLQCARDHSAFAYPREVLFTDRLPRSASGKIDRSSLRHRHAAESHRESHRQPARSARSQDTELTAT
jgi:acyl-coenzyme A synthetase/AMP-(fatty) acid ligase